MEILNLGGASDNNSSAPKTGKRLRVLLGIGALAAVTGIGSTLAANISLNGGNPVGAVEFGQGLVTTAACDDGITVTPVSAFDNAVDEFVLDRVDFSGVSTNCNSKYFLIRAYNNDAMDNQPLDINAGNDYIVYQLGEAEAGSFSVEANNGENVADIFKFTVESFDSNPTPA